MALEITLLGAPRVERDGRPQTFDTRKATALLAHLALAARPRSREALCDLLWPAHDPGRARAALRRTLSTLRTAIGEEWIEKAGDSIALRRGPGLGLDVQRFRELAADTASSQGSLAGAVALFAGGFLEGFSLRDSPEFAGWITFSALEVDGETVAQAQVLMRASDPIFELGLALGGHRQEDRFWQHTLTAVAAHFDHQAEVDTKVVCVDKRRQWSKWRNVWHSSAVRSTLYTMGAPGRALKRLFKRDRAVG